MSIPKINGLGRINLAVDPDQAPFTVDLANFLDFSYDIAEGLEDLVIQYDHDRHVRVDGWGKRLGLELTEAALNQLI